jgi:NADH dehydrogenase [ubiquinone] 1 alpha subcomplex assembly factor 7
VQVRPQVQVRGCSAARRSPSSCYTPPLPRRACPAAFPQFTQALDVHLVELSPALRDLQWRSLKCSSPLPGPGSSASTSTSTGGISSAIVSEGPDQVCRSDLAGSPVSWYRSLDQVPADQPAIYLAHEFLDALPVQQFVKDPQRGWLEKMVDVVEQEGGEEGRQPQAAGPGRPAPTLLDSTGAPLAASTNSTSTSGSGSGSTAQGLRFVLSPTPTPSAAVLVPRRLRALPEQLQQQLQQLEISAPGMALAEKLAQRVGAHGGAALLMDYGKDGPYSDSLQAIRGHRGVELLEQPGGRPAHPAQASVL